VVGDARKSRAPVALPALGMMLIAVGTARISRVSRPGRRNRRLRGPSARNDRGSQRMQFSLVVAMRCTATDQTKNWGDADWRMHLVGSSRHAGPGSHPCRIKSNVDEPSRGPSFRSGARNLATEAEPPLRQASLRTLGQMAALVGCGFFSPHRGGGDRQEEMREDLTTEHAERPRLTLKGRVGTMR